MLHGIDSPQFFLKDTLSKEFNETQDYDVILMNPPFKGAIDKADINPTLPKTTTKTELLFLHLILRALDMGGRSAVIVPDGVLFGSSNAHVEIRKKLIEENRLDGVLSMPSGVFKPYAGVSTAVLFLTRGASTENIWFYDMEHDGFSLDDKRLPTSENDISDILECWCNRNVAAFQAARAVRINELRSQLEPLKAQRHAFHASINRLTFEAAIAPQEDGAAQPALDDAKRLLAELEEQVHPLQVQFNRLSRQFWVSREQVRANKYDLSASRYRQLEQDEVYYEEPQTTMERLLKLETIMTRDIQELAGSLH
ncbi:MAG: SAM-dependent methyltransferase [Chloroflexota bacterium]|nr:SAM-dependent methyltransferase [Chloroflexota bacterium]